MVDTRLSVTPSRLFKPGDALKLFAQSNDDTIISSLTLPKVQSQHVKSGDRALKVIEFFYHLRRPSKASEISDGLGIPRSSAHELLHTLVDTGFLTFDHKRRTYFPSLRIVRLCQWLSPFYFGGTRILDLLESLSELTGENAAASVRNDINMQMVAVVPGKHDTILAVEGASVPILESAAGCALQMTLDDEQILSIIRKVTRRRNLTRNDPRCQEYLQYISRFRVQGFSVVQIMPTLVSIAAPVSNPKVNVPLVVGIGGKPGRIAARAQEFGKLICEQIDKFTR